MKKALCGLAVLGVSGLASAASAGHFSETVNAGLTIDISASLLAAVRQPEPQPAAAPEAGPLSFGQYKKGRETVWYMTVGAGFGADGDDTHAMAFVAWSTFIGRGLEVQLEGNGWYFDQEPETTAGGGFSLNLRWHFWHGSYGEVGGSGYDWTVYADAGIGMIFSGDDVPDGGSSVNFAPRAGVGFTARLGDSDARLVGGVRWHHMSNARSSGDNENPDFNAAMFYVGVEWPL